MSVKLKNTLDIVYEKLLGDNSIPVRLRAKDLCSKNDIEILYNAIDYLIEFYSNKKDIPKKLALAFQDIYLAFSFTEEMYDKETLIMLEDIGIELQEKAVELFSEE